MRPSGRLVNELRQVKIETGILDHAEGSCLISCGNTQVICAASVESRVPPFRRNTGLGWVTAEYAMLPRATSSRNRRESQAGRPSGRTQEIQRLIGRSLRAGVDALTLGERQITIDCDVINADGGTRCAAITGGWVALRLAVARLLESRELKRNPMTEQIAAVSCGVYGGRTILDLDYPEDSEASTDANFVMTGSGKLVEVQCSAEEGAFVRDTLDELLVLAKAGIDQLVLAQQVAVGD